MSGLEELLAAATQDGIWVTRYFATDGGLSVVREEPPIARNDSQARLIALAPDLARLALDMGEQLSIENEKHPNYNITKLLGRLHDLTERQAA